MSDKVLIIKLGALGDIVMSTPLICAIRRQHLRSQMVILTAVQFGYIFENFAGISLKTFNRHSLYQTLEIAKWIRSNNFTHIYDLQSSRRTSILTLMSGAPVRAGNHNSLSYTHFPAVPWKGQQHIFDRMCLLLKTCDINVHERRPILKASKVIEKKISSWLESRSLHDSSYVIMHAGSSPLKPEKRWPYFSALALYFQSKDINTVWVGAIDDESLNLALSEVTGVNASMDFNIFELAELGRRARFAVTNDSGPMHILAAANIPIFGIFGPTDWSRNHALGQEDNVIATIFTKPNETSLAELSVETVIEAISSKLVL